MSLCALEAASRVNEQITVEMLVKAAKNCAKNCAHCSQILLSQ
jgi:hypothetical protein